MKYSLTICFLIVFLILDKPLLSAQEKEPGRLSFALNPGVMILSDENFKEPYNNPYFFSIGAIAGFPIGKFSHIYVKGSIITGEAYYTSYAYTRDPLTDERILESKSQGEKYERVQSLQNVGIQRSFPLKSDFYIFLNGGLSFTRYVEESTESGSSTEGRGFLGGFIGGGLERKLYKNTFSVFTEGVYTNTNSILSNFIGDQAGTNISIGIRFYLPHPKNAINKP